MKPTQFVFLDLETTGLTPGLDEILSAAFMRVDAISFEPIGEVYSARVRASAAALQRMPPSVAQMVGYSGQRWADAVPLREVLDVLEDYLEDGSVIAGHNIGFDVGFLRVFARDLSHGVAARLERKTLDTMQLAWPLFCRDYISSLSLPSVYQHAMGEVLHRAHDAAVDMRASYCVARHILGLGEVRG